MSNRLSKGRQSAGATVVVEVSWVQAVKTAPLVVAWWGYAGVWVCLRDAAPCHFHPCITSRQFDLYCASDVIVKRRMGILCAQGKGEDAIHVLQPCDANAKISPYRQHSGHGHANPRSCIRLTLQGHQPLVIGPSYSTHQQRHRFAPYSTASHPSCNNPEYLHIPWASDTPCAPRPMPSSKLLL